MRYKFLWLLPLFLLASHSHALAQQKDPFLEVEKDSISIGEEFEIKLSLIHPAEQEVFFPRKPTYFAPYELLSIHPHETETKEGVSKDEVTYRLMSLEVDSLQLIQLPVWIYDKGDSASYMSNMDTLLYQTTISKEQLQLQQFTWTPEWLKPQVRGSYSSLLWYFLYVVFGLIIFLVSFRNPLERWFLAWKFTQKHKKFIRAFRPSIRNGENLRRSVLMWKEHLEWLEKTPYSTLSTKEITLRTNNKELGEALKKVDAAIYGSHESEQISLAMNRLNTYAARSFRKRRKEYIKSLKKK